MGEVTGDTSPRTCNHALSATCPVCVLVITTAQDEEFDPQLIPPDGDTGQTP